MKFLSQKPVPIQGGDKPANWQIGEKLQLLQQRYGQSVHKTGLFIQESKQLLRNQIGTFLPKVRQTGFTSSMDDYEKRKLSIFNQLNFLQLITGIIVPIAGLYHSQKFPAMMWVVAAMPPFISILVLWLNARYQHYLAQMSYFVLYPFVTGFVYLSGVNMGLELTFILYGILSVFFLQD